MQTDARFMLKVYMCNLTYVFPTHACPVTGLSLKRPSISSVRRVSTP